VETTRPGELLCLDCSYIGKLKGVGNVWQITACDAASSHAMARVFVLAQPTAEVTARFLRRDVESLREAVGPWHRSCCALVLPRSAVLGRATIQLGWIRGSKTRAKAGIDYDNMGLFADRVAPGHELEYRILVTSQFGTNKVNASGFLKRSKRKDGPR
jgi:hypothetical protein